MIRFLRLILFTVADEAPGKNPRTLFKRSLFAAGFAFFGRSFGALGFFCHGVFLLVG
jgi:hypothetical protein